MVLRRDVFVVSTPIGEDERFAIVHPEGMRIVPFAVQRSLGDWRRVFQDFVRSLAALTESELRGQLAGMGLSRDDVEAQIDRARNLHHFSGEVAWECTTAPGYRNVHGQEVVRKTATGGTRPYQRVYVVRCGGCGHEHRVEGCDVHNSRCPRCQDVASAPSMTPIA
jgi:hypothetical protein